MLFSLQRVSHIYYAFAGPRFAYIEQQQKYIYIHILYQKSYNALKDVLALCLWAVETVHSTHTRESCSTEYVIDIRYIEKNNPTKPSYISSDPEENHDFLSGGFFSAEVSKTSLFGYMLKDFIVLTMIILHCNNISIPNSKSHLTLT
jgi:hypothetical protein